MVTDRDWKSERTSRASGITRLMRLRLHAALALLVCLLGLSTSAYGYSLLTHEQLRSHLRAPDDDRQVSLRVHVRHLRQKLGDASAYPRIIGTEPGLGYRWLLDGSAPAGD